ncbi:MAG: glycosyltransferase family 9 protein, partial [Candidatus Omnitrophica bacterium]|nr:glycosyltransferase family 9 protein [Candidatus Omnitrophota bacterium]
SAVPFDFFQEEDELNMLNRLRQLDISADRGWIVAAPQAASQLKTWNREGFRQVVRRLLEIQTEPVLLVGDTRERETAEAIASVNPSRIYNLAGRTTLKELAVLISRCGLLLANDSAAMHLGFEMQKPVVAIFGPTHDGKYGCVGPSFRIVREPVSCAPCEKPQCRFERQTCFEDLKPEKVLKACEELLHANLSSV